MISQTIVHSIRKSFKISREPVPDPVVTLKPEPEPVPDPVVTLEPEPVPDPVVTLEPEPVPTKVVTLKPVPEPDPVVTLKPEPVPDPVVTLEPVPVPVPDPVVTLKPEPVPVPDPVVGSAPEKLNPLTLSDHVFRYKPCDADTLVRWKYADKNDIRQLIAMIRPLYLFSECSKRCIRTYELYKDDIPRIILKIRKRPQLNIDTSDINLNDTTSMYRMLYRLKEMIGIFHVKNFIVRVEHAFDNSQIRSEYCVVHQLIKHANYDGTQGIDSEHHVVVPVCVQLNNLEKIPESERTLFHHISYSIQPFVWKSQTLDTWLRIEKPCNETLATVCGQLAQALVYLHTYNIVHGDIKPANTLVRISPAAEPVLYLIDYGMSGIHDASEGTGGTKPFCAPETGNGCTKAMLESDTYHWTKNKKENDVWSVGIMFFTILLFGKCFFYQKDYPPDFFDPNTGRITPSYFNQISDEPMRDLFRRTLCPADERITAVDLLRLINTDR